MSVHRSHSNTEHYYYIDFVENIKQFDNDDELIPCFSIHLNDILFKTVFNTFLVRNKIVKQIKKQILYYEM
jgi:hypothetical protein